MDRKIGNELPVQAELVHQHQFGLIAPQKDRNGITRLLIPNLFECYALSIHDPQAQVGIAAHIDDPRTFPEFVADAISLLHMYDGNSYRVRTANLTGPTEERAQESGLTIYLDDEDIEHRRLTTEILIELLRQQNLLDITDERQGEDLGSAPFAALDIADGLQIVERSFNLTPEQLEQVVFEKMRYAFAERMSPGLLPYIPSYVPDDGLRGVYGPNIKPNTEDPGGFI